MTKIGGEFNERDYSTSPGEPHYNPLLAATKDDPWIIYSGDRPHLRYSWTHSILYATGIRALGAVLHESYDRPAPKRQNTFPVIGRLLRDYKDSINQLRRSVYSQVSLYFENDLLFINYVDGPPAYPMHQRGELSFRVKDLSVEMNSREVVFKEVQPPTPHIRLYPMGRFLTPQELEAVCIIINQALCFKQAELSEKPAPDSPNPLY